MRKPAAFRTGNQWWRAAGFACWHLRLFFALVERLLVEFLALSSSAPLVYWLGCLCSLVALLVVLLLVRLEVWFLQLVLRFSLRFSMV